MRHPSLPPNTSSVSARTAIFAVALLLSSLMAQTAAADGISVLIHKPVPFQAVFGEVEVEASIVSDSPVIAVDLYLDDRRIASRESPPWTFKVDVGQENAEHRFRVEVRTADGSSSTVERITPAIEINEAVDVELQQLYVTVTRNGERVLNLGKDAFRVLDDGKQQEIVTFAGGDVPLTAVLLIDSSMSMQGQRLEAALAGARTFADGMRELDEASLMLFSDQLLRATAFAESSKSVLAALDGVRADGDTAVNDHLYLALTRLDARQGRRVVILFTDGADLNSVLDMEEVLWKARRSQALVYWIRLEGREKGAEGAEFSTAWRDADNNRRQFEMLEKAVAQSGGRVASLEEVNEIESAFTAILDELREQYVLGFYPKARNDGAWHPVKVDVRGSGLKVRTRDGYVDF